MPTDGLVGKGKLNPAKYGERATNQFFIKEKRQKKKDWANGLER